jgi:hypothetical protein
MRTWVAPGKFLLGDEAAIEELAYYVKKHIGAAPRHSSKRPRMRPRIESARAANRVVLSIMQEEALRQGQALFNGSAKPRPPEELDRLFLEYFGPATYTPQEVPENR